MTRGRLGPNRASVQQFSVGFDQRIYGPHSIAAIVAELARQGIDPVASLAGTDLTEAQLDTHTTKISYRQLDAVIRNALRLSSDPSTALHVGRRMRITTYGMYGYALLSSPNHVEARDFAARYIRIVGPFCDFSVAGGDDVVAVTFEPLHWQNPLDDVHRFVIEFALSAHLTATRDRVGPAFKFSKVLLDYGAPDHPDVYDQLFECPVLFGQQRSGYEHERDDGPLALADARTHAMAREMCEQLLGEIGRAAGIAAEVRKILIEHPGRYPNIDLVAERLGTYTRALRRKLEAEGTSYRQLLAEVRMWLATEYLRKTQMTSEEIARRLGYSDAANFRHAFLRWTGKSPSEIRKGR